MVLDNRTGADALIGEGPGQPGGDRPPESLERLRYFPRQLLTPADLTQEQDYFRARRRRHNRLLHGWGIVGGCAVRPGTGNWTVQVEPGLVLSPQGDEVFIEHTLGIDLSHQTLEGYVATSSSRPGDPGYRSVTFNPGAIIYLAVAYAEFAVRPVRAQPMGADDTTRFEYSRLRDGFILRVLDRLPPSAAQEPPAAPFTCTAGQVRPYPDYPADPWVVLARITIGAPNIQEADIDSRSDRRYVAGYGDWWFKCTGESEGPPPPPPSTPPRLQAVRLLFTHNDPTDANPMVIGELSDPATPWRVTGPTAWPNAVEFQFAGANVDFANIVLGTQLLAPEIKQARLVPMLGTNSLRLAGIFTPGDYTITLRGEEPAIRSTDGQPLDGDPVRLPSGDGTAGGDFSFRLILLAGQNQPPPPRVGTIRLLRTQQDNPTDPNPEVLAVIRPTAQQSYTVPADHWPNAVEVEFTTAAVDLAAIRAGSQITLNHFGYFNLLPLPDSNSLRIISDLSPGGYSLTLRGDDPAIHSLEGRRLDGEPAQLPSGDGTEGGNFTIDFEVVAGPRQPTWPRIKSVRIVRTRLAPNNPNPEILFTMQDPHQPIRLPVPLTPEAEQARSTAQVTSNRAAQENAQVQVAQAQVQDAQQQLLRAQGAEPLTRPTLIAQAQERLNIAQGQLATLQASAQVAREAASRAEVQAAQLAAQSAPDAIDIEFTGAAIDPASIILSRSCLLEGGFSSGAQVVTLPDNVVRLFAPMSSRQGTYSVTLRGDEPAIRSTQGQRLDGEPNQLPSGDGAEGGNFSFHFDLIPG